MLRSPKRVLLTASLAPIIGLRTAMGIARTTARTGPCGEETVANVSAWDGEETKEEGGTHIGARLLVHLHRDGQDGLCGRVEVLAQALVRRRHSLLDVGRLLGVPTDMLVPFVVAARVQIVKRRSSQRLARQSRAEAVRPTSTENGFRSFEHDLRTRCQTSAELDGFDRGRFDERGRAPLDAADDPAVLAVLLEREKDEVGHARADIDERSDWGDGGDDVGQLVRLDVRGPEDVECVEQASPSRDLQRRSERNCVSW